MLTLDNQWSWGQDSMEVGAELLFFIEEDEVGEVFVTLTVWCYFSDTFLVNAQWKIIESS